MRAVRFLLLRVTLIAIAAGLLIAQVGAGVESKLRSSCKAALLYDNVVEETESAQDDFERSIEIDFHLPAIAMIAEAATCYPRYQELCPTLLVLRTERLCFLHTSLSPPSRA